MKTRLHKLTIVVIIISIHLSTSLNLGFAQAREELPVNKSGVPKNPSAFELYDLPDYEQSESGSSNDFGYTWDDSIPFNWVDASSGTDTGMSGVAYENVTGPISLPFSFKFFENSYNQIRITGRGYLSFTDHSPKWWSLNNQFRPEALPNNVIGSYNEIQNIGPDAWVRYLSGGTAPNRFFVVEWYGVTINQPYDWIIKYEIILYENGNIDNQLQRLIGSSQNDCWMAGIEDAEGSDSLKYSLCNQPLPQYAVRFQRPAPAGRVRVRPAALGQFANAGGVADYRVKITNTGDLGADTYDFSASSTWALDYYAADGVTLLTDTDGDALIDTGLIPAADSMDIIIKIKAPDGAQTGDYADSSITITSSLTPPASKNFSVRSAVPTNFVQIFNNQAVDATSLLLVKPGAQATTSIASGIFEPYHLTVVETADGAFFNFWRSERCLDLDCAVAVAELEYNVTNQFGEILKERRMLTDHSNAAEDTRDASPSTAATPDGRVGAVWSQQRVRWISNDMVVNENIFFAVFLPSGELAYGPVNLTNNSGWSDDPDVPQYDYPTIAGTGDNRFFIAWHRSVGDPLCGDSDCYIDDIYYTVRDSAGSVVKPITRFTNDTKGNTSEGYSLCSATALNNNRVLLLWKRDSNDDIYYSSFDSAGVAQTSMLNLTNDGPSTYDYSVDAAQLSDNRVAIGWTAIINSIYTVRYAVLDANLNRIAGPTQMNNPFAQNGESFVSVVADDSSRAAITWGDTNYPKNLYYALLDHSGAIITPPMVMLSDQSPDSELNTSVTGQGNTTYSSEIPSGVDGVLLSLPALFYVPPGDTFPISVRYTNHGQTTATDAALTLTLGNGLSYVSDTSGITPVQTGNTLTWSLPDITFAYQSGFTVRLSTPGDAQLGTKYPLSLDLSVTAETNPADNTYDGQVIVTALLHMPFVRKR